jgi:hypothetical protein
VSILRQNRGNKEETIKYYREKEREKSKLPEHEHRE